ncbi:MAG: hypothetical protein V3S55_15475 [Nitrospiraceae bacterium]
MPFSQPSRSDVHVNRPLTNISVAFLQSADNFVAGRVFPNVPVAKKSDQYFTYARGEFNRDEMEERAPGTESAGGNYQIGTDTYFARERAYHKNVPDVIRNNADSPISLDREATIFVTHKGLINREVNWVSAFFTAGDPGDTWTFDVDGDASRSAAFDPTDSGNNQVVFWNNSASTPIEDVRLLKRFVLESTGFMPNTLTLGRPVFDTLLDHPDIVGRLDRGQTTGPAQVTKDSLAALFELDDVLVMDSIQNTGLEGLADTHSFIGGKNALLSYKPATPGIMTPSAGYTFSWTGHVGAGNDGMRIKRFRMEALASDRIEIEMAYDQKLVSADLGAFFGAIVQ